MAETAKRLGATAAQTAMFRGVVLNPIDYIDGWLEHNGCQDPPEVTEEAPRLEVSEYQDCAVETVVLEAGPHRWQPYPTARILEFFLEHELSAG
jgi:poly(3-hydroxybutyrate) depolymerase